MNWDQLSQWVPGLDWRLVLVYLRVQACVLALPGLGERVIPARVKVGLAMAVSPLLAGAVAPAGVPDNTATAMAPAAGEVVIGAATGLLLRLLALALDVATSAIAATGGGVHSAESVRHRIKALIDSEAPKKILSDDKIVEMLQREGIEIARRTIAKYRESMHIPSSVQRRRDKSALS